MLKRLILTAFILSLGLLFIIPAPAIAQDGPDRYDYSQFEEPYLIVTAYALNVRTGPDVRFARMGVVRYGQAYQIAGIDQSRRWFYVMDTPYGNGWVRGFYTAFRGNIFDVPVIEGPYEGALEPVRFFLHIDQPVYDAPNGNMVGTLAGDHEYGITGRLEGGGWFELQTEQYGKVWIPVLRGALRGIVFQVPIVEPPVVD